MMIRSLSLCLLGYAVFIRLCSGGILVTGDNDANLTDPGTGVPFEALASVCASGGSNPTGSAIHLQGKYMLTANHVVNRDYVTFDGITYWQRDTNFSPIKIGSADVKLFKLLQDPGITDVQLADGSTTDAPKMGVFNVSATLVNYGRGRSNSDTNGDSSWAWGDNATIAKRWGTNNISGTLEIEDIDDYDYTYAALYTTLSTNAGDNEMGLATYDSGSGIFVEDGGTWYLVGVATLVSSSGSSTFSSSNSDANYFVRISSIADDIISAIPDTTTLAGWLTDNNLYGSDATAAADPDLDGLSNLEEFAMGTDPKVPDSEFAPTVSAGGTLTTLAYQKNASATGVEVNAEWTEDLVGEVWSTSGVTDSTISTENGIEHHEASYSSSADIRFMHLSIVEQ